MTKFLFKVGTYLLLILLIVNVYLFSSFDGLSDPFYLRVTTSRQKSMILGSSRAAQGLNPDIINEELANFTSESGRIYNYAFTLSHSPYGPIYYESILNKLDPKAKNGIFIITVDPWVISSTNISNPNDPTMFRENQSFLKDLPSVSLKYNPFYFLQAPENNWFKKAKNIDSTLILHQNGWLEVTIPMNDNLVQKRTDAKIDEYIKHAKTYTVSNYRLKYLQKLILKLKQHGTLFVIRLPVHKKMRKIENENFTNFNVLMENICKKTNVRYWNLSERNDIQFTDGNHMYKNSGKIISREIGKRINEKLMVDYQTQHVDHQPCHFLSK